MPSLIETQDVVSCPDFTAKSGRNPRVLTPGETWVCELCFDHERDEPFADSLTLATRRFVDRRLEAAIDELKRLDPRHRYAVRLAIDGLTEIRDELGL